MLPGVRLNLPIAADALLSRGEMGDGVIDFRSITGLVSSAGYQGDVEMEIFSAAIREAPGDAVLATIAARYRELVLPHLRARTGMRTPA